MNDVRWIEWRGHRLGVTAGKQELELQSLHPVMADVLEDALGFADRLGWTPVVTSIYRTPREDAEVGGSRVHSQVPHRAVDLRTRDVQAALVADLDRHLDTTWVYDPARPKLTVSYGADHGTGPHLHLQVSWATKRRT